MTRQHRLEMANKEKNSVREIISLYHNPEITEKVAGAFDAEIGIKHPDFAWDKLAQVLRSSRPYTIGLSGKIRFGWDANSVYSPHVMLTNRLTNPDTFCVENDSQGDITILSFGRDSHFYKDLGSVTRISVDVERGGPSSGVNIRFCEPLVDDDGKPDFERFLGLFGDISSGFLLSHENGEVYSMNDVRGAWI